MDGLINILIILGVVVAVIEKVKKAAIRQQSQGTTSTQRTGPAAHRFPTDPFSPQSWKTIFEDAQQENKQTPTRVAAPIHAAASSPASADHRQPLSEGMSSFMEGTSTHESRPSQEGMDICDPSLLGHSERPFWESDAQPDGAVSQSPWPASAGIFPLSVTSDTLVQGFVMSEILARPGQRKWGSH
ncbi:MAG: hypothetical protein GXY67_12315 [Clostridiales bacterium]|nr:hypothetical protein [Clostridiales bacterium]